MNFILSLWLTFYVFFCLFLWFRRLWTTLFVLISHLCAVCFLFSVLMRCLFASGWKLWASVDPINDNDFGVVNVADPKTWVFRRHEYNRISHICRHKYFVINMDAVSLFTNSSFLFLANLNLYYIDVLYQIE